MEAIQAYLNYDEKKCLISVTRQEGPSSQATTWITIMLMQILDEVCWRDDTQTLSCHWEIYAKHYTRRQGHQSISFFREAQESRPLFWMKIAVKQSTKSQSNLCSLILLWAYNVQFSLNLGIKDTSNFEKCREDTFVKYKKQLKDLSEAHWWEQGSLVGWWRTMDKYWFISLDPTLLWNLQVQALELMDQQGT